MGRSHPSHIALGIALLIALGAGCATRHSQPVKPEFERHFERYLSQPHRKAMVIAGDRDDRWTYGYGYAFRSTLGAIDRAYEECRRRVAEDLGGGGDCRLYAVGNRVVEGDPELEALYTSPDPAE